MMAEERLDPSLLFRLDDLERGLLELGAAGAGDSGRAIVHALFREVHNLKGSLAIPGFEASAALAHDMESRLDELRGGSAKADGELVDALLEATDAIRASVESGTDETYQVADAASRLKPRRDKAASALETTRSTIFTLDFAETDRLMSVNELPLYILEKAVSSSIPNGGMLDLPIFSELEALGKVIAWRLSPGAGPGLSLLSVLFASATSSDELRYAIFDPFHPTSSSALGFESPPAAKRAPRSAGLKSDTESAEPTNLSLSRAIRLPRILIVDDEATSLFFLQSILAAYGRIEAVADGPESIERFEAAAKGEMPYSLVFLDILLPSITGIEILERIRDFEGSLGIAAGRGTRVVMSSAMSDYEMVSKAFALGCDGYIVKPFRFSRINTLMKKMGFKPFVAEAGPTSAIP